MCIQDCLHICMKGPHGGSSSAEEFKVKAVSLSSANNLFLAKMHRWLYALVWSARGQVQHKWS